MKGEIDYFAYYNTALTDEMILTEPAANDQNLFSYYIFMRGGCLVLLCLVWFSSPPHFALL